MTRSENPQVRRGRRFVRAFWRQGEAVSEIVGTVLLVALTVVMAGGFVFLLGSFAKPIDRQHSDIDLVVDEGSGQWGTGDERVLIRHLGGEPVETHSTRLVVNAGGITTTLEHKDLAAAVGSEKLTIGQTWIVVLRIPGNADVLVHLINTDSNAASSLVASNAFRSGLGADCTGDTAPPTVSLWVQSPPDLNTEFAGPVTVDATLADNCAGVDVLVVPRLEYRIEDGTNKPFNVPGTAMTLVSGTKWRGTIPDPSPSLLNWEAASGATLQYRVAGMTDLLNNTGTSTTRSDYVQNPLSTAVSFPTCWAVVGMVGACGAMADNDAGALATLTEALATGVPVTEVRTGSLSTSTGGASDDANARTPPPSTDHATLPSEGAAITVSGFATGTGTITKVELLHAGHHVKNNPSGLLADDRLRITYYIGSTETGAAQLYTLPLDTDGPTVARNITSDTTWDWGKISQVKIEATYVKVGTDDKIDFKVNALWLRVTTTATAYDLHVQLNFTGVPAATQHSLQIRYQTSLDTFWVEIHNSTTGTWSRAAQPLSSAARVDWPAYVLSAGEYAGGSPRVRIVDDAGTASQGVLTIEYLRIQSVV